MKRTKIIIVFLSICLTAFGQVKLPQVRGLEAQGWQLQHSVMSWDSLRIYFSAQAPNTTNYDLYVVHANGWRWGEPQRLESICTAEDELWPSISSDERMLFFVHRTPADPAVKKSYEKTRIWRAWQREGAWTEAAPIIVSGDEDSQPTILEDNTTLLFKRRAESKKHDGAWMPFMTMMMDDHNWSLPAATETTPAAQPIWVAKGSLITVRHRKPLTSGKVLVYDAMNEQLLQTAPVHAETGRWRVALTNGRQYRLALTADGFSCRYIDIPVTDLTMREEHAVGTIALDDRLTLTLNTYDAETQTVLATKQEILPLGQMHNLTLQHEGYDDTRLTVNTQRPTVFTETELDIALQPKKSRHRFAIRDARTDEAVNEVQLRLNGQPAKADTALRINQEMTLQVSAQGYLFFDTLFTTGTDKTDRTVLVRLQPLEKDMVLQLRNIQFEYNSYELTESSNDELERLAQLLFTNPSLRIELSAHTDDQGSDRYNDRLSTLRGQAVADWLVHRGVDQQRMETFPMTAKRTAPSTDA